MPTLTIELDTQTEERLRRMEMARGETMDKFVSQLLADTVAQHPDAQTLSIDDLIASLPKLTEPELLQRIGFGWEASRWKRYDELVSKCKAETLTRKEYNELSRLTDKREMLHAERLFLLIELSKRRGVSVEALMNEMRIGAKYA